MISNAVLAVNSVHTNRRQRLIGWAAIVGGGLVMAGAALPWLTFFAGLQTLSGLTGLNGRLLLVGGALGLLGGIWFLRRRSRALKWGLGLYGFALLAFASWLMVQLLTTYFQLAADPMTIPELGPGVFVAVGGALLIFAPLFVAD